MGHPRAKQPRPPSRSRFFEGSMNDRVSAAPPVAFLGAEELAALGQPVPMNRTSVISSEGDAPPKQLNHKKSSLFGQVWDGVRGRLGFRRGAGDDVPAAKRKSVTIDNEPTTERTSTDGKEERPSREDILANYHQLVASGFFSAHAIQSSRRPPPASTSRPTSPTAPLPQDSNKLQPPILTPNGRHPSPDQPQWPLTPAGTRPTTPVRSPVSAASSRGTKRAAAADGEDDPVVARETTPKKLRKSDSRDVVNLPKLRNVASRRNILTRRSMSNVRSESAPREPNRLSKRVLAKLPGGKAAPAPAPLDVPSRGSSARRNVSDSASTRVLRPRQSGLSVKPDANQGIPTVPAIPLKFTYGEDRENDGPWRGLRRPQRNSAATD